MYLKALCLLLLIAISSGDLDVSCFTNSGAVLSTPASASWDTDKEVFNEKVITQPAAVAYAHTEAEVQSIIECAQSSGLKVNPRSGGHGYEGYAAQTGQIVLDITNLTSFTVDETNNLATFGSGTLIGPLYLKMYEANSLYPAGLCPFVGTGGHLLGGGNGMNSRSYGQACDQVVQVRMVDYKGDIIVANKDNNSDLLWASCGGGGGNLGVVTAFTVKMHSLDDLPVVTTAEINFAGYDSAAEVFDKVQKWAPSADNRLGVQILIGFGGVGISIQWQGNQQDAAAEISQAGFLGLPGLYKNEMQEESWVNASLRWAATSMGISNSSIYNLNLTAGLPQSARSSFQAGSSYNQAVMSMEGIQTMVAAVASQGPQGTAWVEHKMLQGAVGEVGQTDTAFFWRNSLYESQWYYFWNEGDQSVNASNWLSTSLAKMRPYVGQGAYLNYPDPNLAQNPNWPSIYYGGNLAAYVAVKTKYDPNDYFSNPLTVKPSPGIAPALPLNPRAATPGPSKASTSNTGSGAAAVQVGGGGNSSNNGAEALRDRASNPSSTPSSPPLGALAPQTAEAAKGAPVLVAG